MGRAVYRESRLLRRKEWLVLQTAVAGKSDGAFFHHKQLAEEKPLPGPQLSG